MIFAVGAFHLSLIHWKGPTAKETDVRYVEQVQPLAAFVPCSFQVSPCSFQVSPLAGGICLGTLRTSMFLMFSSRHVEGNLRPHLK